MDNMFGDKYPSTTVEDMDNELRLVVKNVIERNQDSSLDGVEPHLIMRIYNLDGDGTQGVALASVNFLPEDGEEKNALFEKIGDQVVRQGNSIAVSVFLVSEAWMYKPDQNGEKDISTRKEVIIINGLNSVGIQNSAYIQVERSDDGKMIFGEHAFDFAIDQEESRNSKSFLLESFYDGMLNAYREVTGFYSTGETKDIKSSSPSQTSPFKEFNINTN